MVKRIFEGNEKHGNILKVLQYPDVNDDIWIISGEQGKPVDSSIILTPKTALAMAQAILKDMDYVSMPKYIWDTMMAKSDVAEMYKSIESGVGDEAGLDTRKS